MAGIMKKLFIRQESVEPISICGGSEPGDIFVSLTGLRRQGVRCKACKMSVHHKCRDNVPYCRGEIVSIPCNVINKV